MTRHPVREEWDWTGPTGHNWSTDLLSGFSDLASNVFSRLPNQPCEPRLSLSELPGLDGSSNPDSLKAKTEPILVTNILANQPAMTVLKGGMGGGSSSGIGGGTCGMGSVAAASLSASSSSSAGASTTAATSSVSPSASASSPLAIVPPRDRDTSVDDSTFFSPRKTPPLPELSSLPVSARSVTASTSAHLHSSLRPVLPSIHPSHSSSSSPHQRSPVTVSHHSHSPSPAPHSHSPALPSSSSAAAASLGDNNNPISASAPGSSSVYHLPQSREKTAAASTASAPPPSGSTNHSGRRSPHTVTVSAASAGVTTASRPT